MADNVEITAGVGTTVATDEIGGAHYQKMKIHLGAENSNAGPLDGGAGSAASTTLRAILASDDPAVTALQVIDDWDESDRAKVNIITGQAGITAGAGNVAANTPRVTLAADNPLPSGRPPGMIGRVLGHEDTNYIWDGESPLTPKLRPIGVGGAGSNITISGVAGKSLRVVAIYYNVAADVNVTLEDGAGGPPITGQNNYKAGSGLALPYNPKGWMQTSRGNGLSVRLSSAVSLGGALAYVEV